MELVISATDSCSWLVMVEAGLKAEMVISVTDSVYLQTKC